MLNYKTIDAKPAISLTLDGEKTTIKDLLTQTYSLGNGTVSGTPIVINEYYVGRPDLVSLAIYNTDEYADLICKFNGISNPFELNEDMVIFCPNFDVLQSMYKYGNKKSELTTDVKKTEITQKYVNDRRSPADQIVGDKNYRIDKSLGIVIY